MRPALRRSTALVAWLGFLAVGTMSGATALHAAHLLGAEEGAAPMLQAAPAADSADVLEEVQLRVRDYIRDVRRSWDRRDQFDRYQPMEVVQEERPKVIQALDEAAEVLPGDDWIAGHRVGMRVKHERLDEAVDVARECQASRWWCAALSGLAHHMRGDSAAAHHAFDDALEAMPRERRCEWNEHVRHLLAGGIRSAYGNADCEERDRLAEYVWWLADPFHLLPFNDRRSEHLARMVGMELRCQQRALVGGVCRTTQYFNVVTLGWPDWLWSFERGESRPRPLGHRFVPPPGVAMEPFDAEPWDWDLEQEARFERVHLDYDIIHPLQQQTALFRRGDSMRVVVAADMHRHVLRGAPSLDMGVVFSREPPASPVIHRVQRPPERMLLDTLLPEREYLVSVEALAEPSGAARSRFGVRLPAASPEGLALSHPVLLEWSDALDRLADRDEVEPVSLDSVLDHVIGSDRLRSGREVGVFWEMYGLDGPEPEAVEISITIREADEGRLRRLARWLRIAGPSQVQSLSWEEAVGAEAIQGRVLRIRLPDVDPGRYLLEVSVSTPDGEPVVVRRQMEISAI